VTVDGDIVATHEEDIGVKLDCEDFTLLMYTVMYYGKINLPLHRKEPWMFTSDSAASFPFIL